MVEILDIFISGRGKTSNNYRGDSVYYKVSNNGIVSYYEMYGPVLIKQLSQEDVNRINELGTTSLIKELPDRIDVYSFLRTKELDVEKYEGREGFLGETKLRSKKGRLTVESVKPLPYSEIKLVKNSYMENKTNVIRLGEQFMRLQYFSKLSRFYDSIRILDFGGVDRVFIEDGNYILKRKLFGLKKADLIKDLSKRFDRCFSALEREKRNRKIAAKLAEKNKNASE